ncbi:hypothetical protein C9994_07570 [Marivirga lumbricoides]|uniref:Uncharacterized protein n=1 Tax=Marivirga lumbricoides TaxID=1046115 RepID=A0A2T4DRF1_9BACT|nr:hypothetical protein C9994_07570 [Marivirga lumbricoides]
MKELTKKIVYVSTAIFILTSFSKDNSLNIEKPESITIDQSLKYEMAVDNLHLITNHTTGSLNQPKKREQTTFSFTLTKRKSGTKNRIYHGSYYRMYALD